MRLPPMVNHPTAGLILPPTPFPDVHRCTMAELRIRFVDEAPAFKRERAFLYRTLELYADQVWGLLPEATLWIDGGFVTHKDWAAPQDVDLVILPTESDFLQYPDEQELKTRLTPLLTLQNVTAAIPQAFEERVQPYGGNIDGFLVPPGIDPAKPYWHDLWSRVRGRGGAEAPDAHKGFVEVVRGDD